MKMKSLSLAALLGWLAAGSAFAEATISVGIDNWMNYRLSDFTDEPLNEPLNDGMREWLLKLIATHSGARLPYLKSVVGVSTATVKRTIAALVRAGKIEHRGSKKTGGYFVKEV